MAKAYGLTREQQKRVGRVVTDYERQGPARLNSPSDTRDASLTFWALLTGESPGNPGRYSWKRQVPDGYDLADTDPAIVVADFTAQEVNLTGGMVGKYVVLQFGGYDTTSTPRKPIYFFSASSAAPVGQYPGQGWFTVADNQTAMVYPFAVQTV